MNYQGRAFHRYPILTDRRRYVALNMACVSQSETNPDHASCTISSPSSRLGDKGFKIW